MKKGFTLVELLAVIAILAILVIIALPNVMGMFNQAKKNSFTTEIKEIYKVAQQTWMSESMFNTSDKVYSRCSGCTNPLDLSGREELKYYIRIDKSGKVAEYYATDGTYQYDYSDGDLKIENIKDVQAVTDVNPNQVLNITPGGKELGEVRYLYYNGGLVLLGENVPESDDIYDNYMDAINSKKYWKNSNEGYKFFVRLKAVDNKIEQADLGYMVNNNVYYLKAFDPSAYQNNKSILMSSIDSQYCDYGHSDMYDNDNHLIGVIEEYSCYIPGNDTYPGLYISADDRGNIDVFDSVNGNSAWSCCLYDFVNGNMPNAIYCTVPD